MLIDYLVVDNLAYHKKQIEYLMKALVNEIKKAYPDIKHPDFNDPRFAQLLKDMPYNPVIAGGLASSLGIGDKVLTLDMWEDFNHGYARADYIKKDHPLYKSIIDTPRGKMVKLNKNPSEILPTGAYKIVENPNRRPGVEFVFGMPSNVSVAVGALAIEDNTVELRFKKAIMSVLTDHVLPEMKADALKRMGAQGVNLQLIDELLSTMFLHPENRNAGPYFHVHMVLLNTALGFDGNLHSVSTEQIIQFKDKYNAIFQSRMKPLLENEFGFVFKPVYLKDDLKNEHLQDHERNIVAYDLIDDFVPENVRKWASSRAEEIEHETRKKGKALTHEEKEIARLETRNEKSELTPGELKAHWNEEFTKMGFNASHVKKHQNFNQEAPKNIAKSDDKQLCINYQRKIFYQDKRKKEEFRKTHGNSMRGIAKKLHKNKARIDDALTRALEEYKDMGIQSKESIKQVDDALYEKNLISGFLRKHKSISFSEEQFVAHMVKQLLETHTCDEAWKKATYMFESECVHILDKEQVSFYQDFLDNKITDPVLRQTKQIQFQRDVTYTTKHIISMEKEIHAMTDSKLLSKDYVFSKEKIDDFIKRFLEMKSEQFGKKVNFSKGQKEAFINNFTDLGNLAIVLGRAGSGKSFLMEAVKLFAEENGIKVLGTSISSAATIELKNSTNMKDNEAYNLTKMIMLIKSGEVVLDNKTILIIDESGMLDLEIAYEITKLCNEKGAKIIMSGEKEQLQNIGLGSVHRTLSEHYKVSAINEINRQKCTMQREMVEDAASGRSSKSLRYLSDIGNLFITDTDKQRIEKISLEYISSTHEEEKAITLVDSSGNRKKGVKKVMIKDSFKQKLLIATSNFEATAINESIREKLKESGELKQDLVNVQCDDKVFRGFSEGDRVMFTKATDSMDIEKIKISNSSTGTVKRVLFDRLTNKPISMEIELDTGVNTFIDITGKKNINLKHGYCVTTYKSQGVTKKNTYLYPSANINSLHHCYVSMSRHTDNCYMYLSKEMADKLATKVVDHVPTMKMKQVAEWVSKSRGEELLPEDYNSFLTLRAYLNKNYEEFDKVGIEKHPLDDFTNLISSMGQTSYKKSVHDYKIMSGEEVNAFKQIKSQLNDIKSGKVLAPESYKKAHDYGVPVNAIKHILDANKAQSIIIKKKLAEIPKPTIIPKKLKNKIKSTIRSL